MENQNTPPSINPKPSDTSDLNSLLEKPKADPAPKSSFTKTIRQLPWYANLLLFLFVFAIAASIPILFEKSKLVKDLNERLTTTITPIPSQSDNQTANWKTYTDITNGFSVKYPAEWREEIRDSTNIDPAAKVVILTPDPYSGQIQGITITVTENEDNLTAREYAENVIIPFQEGSVCEGYITVEESQLNLGDSLKVLGLCGIFNQGPMLIIAKDNEIIRLSSGFQENDEKLINEIYSTFKFTDSEQPNNDLKEACEEAEGSWSELYKECTSIDSLECTSIGGVFDECASPCRHNPDAEVCITLCVEVCKL